MDAFQEKRATIKFYLNDPLFHGMVYDIRNQIIVFPKIRRIWPELFKRHWADITLVCHCACF